MAPRGSRNAPKPRDANKGDNALAAGEEDALVNQMLENIKAHKLKKAAFKTKMAQKWETEVAATAKRLRMPMTAVMAFYEDHAIETGDDKDSVEKAERKRARHLDTQNRLYKATHDGSQIDLVKMAEIAAKADAEAEAEANAPVITEDDEDAE